MNSIQVSNDPSHMSSLPSDEIKSQRELGVIEKLCATYGFVYCCHRDGRYFFHFSEYKNDIQQAKIGDVIEFETTIDKRKKKPVAVNIVKLANTEIVGENRVEGAIAIVSKISSITPHSNGRAYDNTFSIPPDGHITYVKKGETFYIPYGLNDLQDPNLVLKVGDKVSFNVAQDRRTNQFFARNVSLVESVVPKKYRGVVSTMKDSFGFIEREDAVKETFFHISEVSENGNMIHPGAEVEFEIQDRHNKEVASNIVLLPEGSVVFDDIDQSFHIGRVTEPLTKPKKANELLTGRILYDNIDTSVIKLVELSFGERDRVGQYTLLENDIVQFHIATDKRDGVKRATQIQLLDQSFLKSKERRETGIVTKLVQKTGGVIKCTNRDETVTFRFSEVMKDSFQIAEGDLLEFTVVPSFSNGSSSAIRIKLHTKEPLKNDTTSELNFVGVVEKDAGDFKPMVSSERNGRTTQDVMTPATPISTSLPSMPLVNGDASSSRQQEPGIISYEQNGKQCTMQFITSGISNTTALYCGDKVEFSVSNNASSKQSLAFNIRLIERNRIRGWIAIFRENRGFIEQNGDANSVLFSSSSIAGDPTQLDLGDEVEFSLRKSTGRLTAENIIKVALTVNSFYSTLPTTYHGRVVSPVRMLNNEECEVLGKIQKVTDGTYEFSLFGDLPLTQLYTL
ncbi:unnamed protein product [Didymodactylos carnosus]|uniref:CSD domain-containing protein n=1 Tax=Didymodactylos carnosus TaxID=1234261 RepID=A0A8S2HA59_9BILA|nr:unnamed protein product [Didymodactylos carnosus]CAF3615050.1 unnamed protein product [Didymodactylos carnosus]